MPRIRAGNPLFVGLVALVVASCASTNSSPASASGSWSRSTASVSLDMTLAQVGQAVSGSGAIVVNSTSYGVSISGSLINSDVELTLTAGGYRPVAFSATLSGGTMSGSLSGSGFPGTSITETRQ